MKKERIFCLIVVFLLLLTGCSNSSTNYDAIILDNASLLTSELGFDTENNPFADGTRYFNVTKNSKNEFLVDVNGTEMRIRTPDTNTESEYEPQNSSIISKKYEKIIKQSKKLVYQYIDSSTILDDKNGIKNYIDKLSIKEASFTEADYVGAYFSYTDNCVYINRNLSSVICEWMLVHEFVHAISYYTHGCSIEKEEYAFNLFNEILTDIITASLSPKIGKDIQSGYIAYYGLLAPYINLFGEHAVKAYFYGYNAIYEKIGHDEFEFFVIVIENYDAEYSDVYYNNLIFKWYANNPI